MTLHASPIRVRPATANDLNTVWFRYRLNHPFAATVHSGPSGLLRDDEWIFASSPETLVLAVLQWKARNIQCQWVEENNDGYWHIKNLPAEISEDDERCYGLSVAGGPESSKEEIERRYQRIVFDALLPLWEPRRRRKKRVQHAKHSKLTKP